MSERQSPRNLADRARRRQAAAAAGHSGDESAARSLLTDPDPQVRSTALGALERLGTLRTPDLLGALGDEHPVVRRRACEAVGAAHLRAVKIDRALVGSLDDRDTTVAEMAAWSLGELNPPAADAVTALARVAGQHRDALCREAAVAALGALADPDGLPAILAAMSDKPAVRRRAVLALAPFDGPDVDDALRTATADRDWQVRQAAEDLLRDEP